MDAMLAHMLAEPDRWLGGELHNYGHVRVEWSTDLKMSMLEEPDYPRKARITTIQLEDIEYFCVIGETVDHGPSFACNGQQDEIHVTSKPVFPCLRPGELAIHGPLVNGARHEWHLIPREA